MRLLRRLAMIAVLAGALAAGGLCAAGCRSSKGRAVSVIGSTSIQPFAEMLAEEYNRLHSDGYVEVQGGGSTAGLQAVTDGIADIGMCSRGLKDSEKPFFKPIVIARDGLAVVVHPSNSIAGLSRKQVTDLFSGAITNWKDVGGPDRPVRLITREEGSGTREAFQKLVMGKTRISRKAMTQESNGAVKELVIHDAAAIGYMSLGLVGEAKILRIDGVTPSIEAVQDGSYPLVRPFLFVVSTSADANAPAFEAAMKYVDFVLSRDGQALLIKEGLVGAAPKASTAPAAMQPRATLPAPAPPAASMEARP